MKRHLRRQACFAIACATRAVIKHGLVELVHVPWDTPYPIHGLVELVHVPWDTPYPIVAVSVAMMTDKGVYLNRGIWERVPPFGLLRWSRRASSPLPRRKA